MAFSKRMIRATVVAGVGCAALAAAIMMADGSGGRGVTASPSQNPAASAPVLLPTIPVNPRNGGVAENVWNATLFADAFRATHIARGYVVSCDYPTNNVMLRFQPTEYIKGTPLPDATVDLVTGLNADLNFTVGQEAVCAWIVRESDGAMGLSHSVNSMTPAARGWNPQATVDFIRAILAINEEAGEDLQVRLTGQGSSDVFQAPMWVREAWVDALVDALGVPGSMAAYHAGMELDKNPAFSGMLKPAHLERIAGYATRSLPATHDRGYHFILLRKYNHASVGVSECVRLLKEETANVLVDHISNYLATQHDEMEVATGLAPLILNLTGVSPAVRANAIMAAGSSGNRRILPTLRSLLGHEKDDKCRRELLNALRSLPDPANLDPLVNYLNGGDAANKTGIQFDCRNSMNLHKRALLAIAAINSPESNECIRQAYERTRVPEFKRFLRPLLEDNKGWRSAIVMLEGEDDKSLDDHFADLKAKGIFE